MKHQSDGLVQAKRAMFPAVSRSDSSATNEEIRYPIHDPARCEECRRRAQRLEEQRGS